MRSEVADVALDPSGREPLRGPMLVRPNHPAFIGFIRWLYKRGFWVPPVRSYPSTVEVPVECLFSYMNLHRILGRGGVTPFPDSYRPSRHRLDGGRQSMGHYPRIGGIGLLGVSGRCPIWKDAWGRI